jgi:TonB-linked SusC/RagA family outer membrane protein
MKKVLLALSFLMVIGLGSVLAQAQTITGTVTGSEDGMPIPGVSVFVKGTTVGTVTQVDGTYSLNVPGEAETIVFSFIGMQSQEIPYEGQTTIDVVMEPTSIALNEIVATAMGIERSRKSLTYAVSEVAGEEASQKMEPDMLKSLQGKIPGVNISGSTGTPGSATRITIRGNSSFLGNNQPLFVVDGIPYSNEQYNTSNQLTSGGSYSNGIATLDPNNVESMKVLKGAAAAALYGSRAANGVVLITTKSGGGKKIKEGLEISVNSSVAVEEISNLPDYQNKYGAGAGFTYADYNGSWGAPFSSLETIPMWGNYASAFGDDLPSTVPYVARPDNVERLFNTGILFDNSISASGGNKDASITVTASDLRQDGYVPHSEYDKKALSVGGQAKLSNNFDVGGNLSYTKSKQQGMLLGASNAQDVGQASSMARTLWLARDWDTALPYSDPQGNSVFFKNVDHPLWSWEHNGFTSEVDRIVAGVNASYDILDWLNASFVYGINTYNDRRQQITDIGSTAYNGQGSITDDHIWNQETESNFTLTVRKPLGGGINLRTTGGFNVNQREYERTTARGVNMSVPDIFRLTNTNDQTIVTDYYSMRRLYGAYLDATLEYNNYLFLNLTGRNDWSSTLPSETRSFFYPAASLSFDFTDAFDIQGDVFTNGRVRLAWAKVGNDADPYSLNNLFFVNPESYETNYPFRDTPAITASNTYTDPELSPEFTDEKEFGTALVFFNGKISFDFTYYDRRTTDQIASVSLPDVSGYSSFLTNFGELSNKGIEVGLDITPVSLDNSLKWNIFTSFSKNESNVEALTDGVDRVVIRNLFGGGITPVLEVGQPYGVLLGTVAARDDNGNFLIDPNTGQMLEDTEQKIVGDPNPDYLLSVTNTLSFKGFSLRALFDYKHGGDIFSSSIQSFLGRGVTKDTEDREKGYIIPGVYGDADDLMPILDANGNTIANKTQISMNDVFFASTGTTSFAMNGADEFSIYDATVLRLRELALSYEVPNSLLDSTPFGSASITFTGRNLWFFAPNIPEYSNFDPEINSFGSTNVQGIEYGSMPSTKRYGVNLKFTF